MEALTFFSETFLIRLVINTATTLVIVKLIHNVTHDRKEFNFTYFLFNLIVFLLTNMLSKSPAFGSISTGFGLVAAFSLLRFRTETLSLKDMTYLFIIMTVGLINAIMGGSYVEIVGVNAMIILAVFIADSNRIFRSPSTKIVEYPSIENIQPQNHSKLLAELRVKTGLDIQKFNVEQIDMTKNKVTLKIYYF